MKRIYLLRHSDASFESQDGDFERQLTHRGVDIAKRQGKLLQKKNYVPNLIISSDATRALETTAIFVDVLGLNKKVERQHFLYEEYTTNDFLNMVHAINQNVNSVLITGHNPNISTIAYRLSPECEITFPPCTLAVFDFDIDDWSQLEVGQGKLKEILLP